MEPENDAQAEDAADVRPPIATCVSAEGRERWVTLSFPVEYDGRIWDRIRVRRISAKELRDYLSAVGEEFVMPPVVDCSIAIWDAMDADDQADVDEAAIEFMPRRLRAAAEALMTAVAQATPSSAKEA